MPPQTMRQFLKPPEKAPDTLPRTQSTMSLLDYFSTVIQGLADPTGWTEPKAEDFDNPHAYTQALKAHGVGQLLGMAAPLAAPLAAALKLKGVRQGTSTIAEYQGIHAPPMADSGAPLHDLTGGGRIYPDDVYSPKAAQYYGPGGDRNDVALFRQIHALKDKPDATVKVWRAVPKNAPVSEIQHGDWVTISKKYAQEHGEGPLRGDYKLIEAEVPAKTLFTNGDSPYEFGLDLSVLPPEAPQTLKAFHGSPHDFEQFSSAKIGTGEGAQAYGHGLYFGEREGTAAEYRKALASPKIEVGGKPLAAADSVDEIAGAWLEEGHLKQASGLTGLNPQTYAREGIAEMIDRAKDSAAPNVIRDYKRALTRLDEWERRGLNVKPGGHMYEVNIHASPDELLDWDKPLSQQPQKLRTTLEKVGIADPEPLQRRLDEVVRLKAEKAADRLPNNVMRDEKGWHALANEADALQAKLRATQSGQAVYDRLGSMTGMIGKDAHIGAAEQLHEAGIKGIQYLDQGSRAAGEGTRNFVIFDDTIIEIAKKYGISLPAAASLYKWQQSHKTQKGVE